VRYSSKSPISPGYPLARTSRLKDAARIIILDRDGVINRDSNHFIRTTSEWHPIDGSLEAIALLTDNGFKVAVATNQSGLARGLFDRAALLEIHRTMAEAVTAAGGRIDHVVFCPHGPDEGCDCRKPGPGMLLQIADQYGVDLQGIPFVGDSLRDLEAAWSVGARGILVRSGKGYATEKKLGGNVGRVDIFDNLLQVARFLVAEIGR